MKLITCLFPLSALAAFFTLSSSARADGGIIIKDGQKVAFMGDSITDMGWKVPGGYIQLVTAGLQTLGVKIVPIPAGVGGNTSVDMLARLDRDVLSKKPDWMTLSCGVNDVWHGANGGVRLDAYEKNITSIVDQAQAAGIKVVLLTSTVIDEDLNNDNNQKLIAYNAFLHQLAKDRQLPIAEENDAFQAALKASPPAPGYKLLLTQDGVHPNPDGHQIMATALLRALGATPAQIDTVKQAWLDLPSGAYVVGGISFRTMGPITIRQYNAIKAMAAAKQMTMENFCQDIYFQAVVESYTAQKNGPPLTGNVRGDLEAKILAKYIQKLADLAK